VPSFKSFLKDHQLNFKDLSFFISHPGGPKVLQALEESLDIPADDLALSYKSLAEHGNMSSVSVLNVLEQHLNLKSWLINKCKIFIISKTKKTNLKKKETSG